MLILFLQKTFQQIIKRKPKLQDQRTGSFKYHSKEEKEKDNFAFIFKLIDTVHSHTMKI